MAFIDASRNDTDLTPNATAFTAYDDSNYQNGMSKFFESLKSVGFASSAYGRHGAVHSRPEKPGFIDELDFVRLIRASIDAGFGRAAGSAPV
ncbi:hypothetical protein [Burkholderia ambifaria]|uniref:hypothetical protein n=1 Tax=Burkholderia ambifaria TaxID=152480 RepID=UPI00158B07F9|nr:hypothetical protein [Burkholderia ambifaria]